MLGNQSAASMASATSLAFLSLFFFFSILPSLSSSLRPKGLVVPVSKEAATSQYVIRLHQRTPLGNINVVLHLGGGFLWVNCDSGYSSSTYRPIRCRSAQCAAARSFMCGDCVDGPRPGCNNNTCGFLPENPFIRTSSSGELAEDVLSLPSTDGSNPGPRAVTSDFVFGCGSTSLTQGLARGAVGIAGLGRNRIGMPSQLAAAFNFRRRFALCLTRTPGVDGAVFFGNGPYVLLPGIDVSKQLLYTPLLVNPVSTASASFAGEPSVEYFVGVTSIKVNNQPVTVDRTLLAINKKTGVGGTKISSAEPYTVLQSSIYKAVVGAFARESGVRRVASVRPFGFCFDSTGIGGTRVGPAVPQIDLVMQSELVYWRMFGANSVVAVRERVMCLAFVDGGAAPTTSMVIGGYQLEDNLVEVDLAASRLGFSSSLLFRRTTCANFNFTSKT